MKLRRWTGWWLVFAALVCISLSVRAVDGSDPSSNRSRPLRERQLPGSIPAKPSLPPAASIPVEPLGFSAPGPLYLGERDSMASLNFLDENRLLFTFRVPGLIHRQFKDGESQESDERQIKALVLTLPAGAVEAESLWTVHDRSRYLWMLKDGQFLVRDGENLLQGDAHLDLKSWLQFPGHVLRLDVDPSQQLLVSNSLEPVSAPAKPGTVGNPSTASADVTTDDQNPVPEQKDYVVRILRRDSGQVMLVSRTRGVVHLPINSDGYIENLRGRADEWVLNMNYFTGGTHLLGSVNSSCIPTNEFISKSEVLVTGCDVSGAIRLVAMTTDGKTLWDDLNPPTTIWPVLARSASGLRIAEVMLEVTHAVNAYAPIGNDDIKGQVVRVFDAATGEIAFESPVSPILDAGGNVAISPSGRRIAIVNAGSIQVFDLPAPPPLPNPGDKQPAH